MPRNPLNSCPPSLPLVTRLLAAASLVAMPVGCGDDEASAGMGMTDSGTTGGTDETITGEATGESQGASSGSSEPSTGSVDSTSTGESDDTTVGEDDSTGEETTGTGGEVEWNVEVEQAGGQPRDLQVVGGVAFAAQGPRLTLWDVSDPTDVTKLGETEPFVGIVSAVAVLGDRAYVTEYQDLEGRLHIVDVSDPTAPTVADTIDYTDSEYRRPEALSLDGDRLYLSDTEVGVFEFDVSDPSTPVVINDVTEFGITELAAVEDRVYIGLSGFIGTSVGALDRSNDLEFLGLGGVDESLGLAFSDDHHVVSTGVFGTSLYDLDDINSPTTVFSDALAARTVVASGSRAYVPHAAGLTTLDWSEPGAVEMSAPSMMASDRTTAAGVASDTLVMMTELGRLLAVDVAAEPVLGDEIETPGCVDCTDAAVVGDHVVVADFYYGARVLDAATLDVVGRLEVPGEQPGVEGVVVQGDYAYLADWSSGLHVFDIRTPSAPAHVGYVATGGFPASIAVLGNHVYVGESTNGGALRVVDVSDPSAPQVIAMLPTSQTFDIQIAGELAFLADGSTFGDGGMRIVDISDPSAPTVIGHYLGCTSATGVGVGDGVAIVACSGAFHIVDVEDPTSPSLITTFEGGDIYLPYDAVIEGDRAYLGHGYGLDVVDIEDPSSPELLSFQSTAFPVRAIELTKARTVALSAALGGLYHWELD